MLWDILSLDLLCKGEDTWQQPCPGPTTEQPAEPTHHSSNTRGSSHLAQGLRCQGGIKVTVSGAEIPGVGIREAFWDWKKVTLPLPRASLGSTAVSRAVMRAQNGVKPGKGDALKAVSVLSPCHVLNTGIKAGPDQLSGLLRREENLVCKDMVVMTKDQILGNLLFLRIPPRQAVGVKCGTCIQNPSWTEPGQSVNFLPVHGATEGQSCLLGPQPKTRNVLFCSVSPLHPCSFPSAL